MKSHVTQRPATTAELAQLHQLLRDVPTDAHRWRRGMGNGAVLWAASLLVLSALWLAFSGFELSSPATRWAIGTAAVFCAVVSAVSSARWVRGWPDHRPSLRLDIERAVVSEEHYVFTDVCRFREPQHGGLLYFFRTDEDKVLVDHDYPIAEATDGVPSPSGLQPREWLCMIRAPASTFVLVKQFSGEPLAVGEPIELAVPSEDCPESETLCDIPWNDLVTRLGSPGAETPGRHSLDA